MNHRLAPGTFYGEASHALEVNGFYLSESLYEPGLQTPTHTHETAFFYLILRGNSTETYSRKTRQGGPSTLVFHPAGEPHANCWHDEGGHCFHIEILAPALPRLREASAILDQPMDFHSGWPAWLSQRLYTEYRNRDCFSFLTMEGLILELLAAVSRPKLPSKTDAPKWLLEVKDRLHDQFSENLSLDVLAQTAKVHPAHLARAFRLHFNSTLGDYLRHLRVDYACRQLSQTDLPLVEIALSAGFSDQSHFSRILKAHQGLTPTEFRKWYRAR
jgi:AraC family transcriptional regulator